MVATYLFAMSASISLVRLTSGVIQLILMIVPKAATYPNQSKRPWHPSYGERRMDRSPSTSFPFLGRFECTALTIAQITATAISSTPIPPSRNTKNCFGSLAHHQRFIGTCMPQSSVTTPMKHVNTPSAMVEPLLPEGLMMSSPVCRFLRPSFAPAAEAV